MENASYQKKAEKYYKKSKNKAQDLIDNPEKANKLLNDAVKMSEGLQGPLERVWEDLQLMFGIIKDWFSGEYKEIPVGSIIAILGTLIYFVSPIDLIPDFIPVIGISDDLFVLGLTIKQLDSDLKKYKLWKESKTA